jgi:hypothetical protein
VKIDPIRVIRVLERAKAILHEEIFTGVSLGENVECNVQKLAEHYYSITGDR